MIGENKMPEDNVPFEVTNPTTVEDLTDVREQKYLLPVTTGLKVRVNKAAVQENKTKDLKGLKLELRLVDGIEVTDQETGASEIKFVNKPIFTGIMDLCFYADPATRGGDWFKTKQHLVEFKKFISALGYDLKGIVVDDTWLQNLVGREVLVDVLHEEETSVDAQSGERKKLGTFREKLKNWKPVV
jgi:hypothetical protein